MTQSLVYRPLTRPEIDKLAYISRSETIERVYTRQDDELILQEEYIAVPDWSPREQQRRIAYLQEVFDKGATFFGAFTGDRLAGLAVLDHNPVQTGRNRLQLAGLWVSAPARGQSVGRTLFQLAVKEAWNMGAEVLYISATPSENTVRFYLNLGCRLADPVDPALLAKEPDDIHLELVLLRQTKQAARKS
ncbi:MAG: GNAT family N-acetyltransferase [Candidatus Promineifilaceae bacterium]|nr:GNAT family N-acetyltransferase [Candidatus Promineifilaceae bacterium]